MILSYTEPFNRRDPILLLADVARAIEYFKGYGELKKLYLNPMYLNEKYKTFLKFDRPDDVEVEEHAGCGSWEIQGEIKEKPLIVEVTGHRGAGMSLADVIISFEGARGDDNMTQFATLNAVNEYFKGTKSPPDKCHKTGMINNRAQKGKLKSYWMVE